jgi:hypothetical protein
VSNACPTHSQCPTCRGPVYFLADLPGGQLPLPVEPLYELAVAAVLIPCSFNTLEAQGHLRAALLPARQPASAPSDAHRHPGPVAPGPDDPAEDQAPRPVRAALERAVATWPRSVGGGGGSQQIVVRRAMSRMRRSANARGSEDVGPAPRGGRNDEPDRIRESRTGTHRKSLTFQALWVRRSNPAGDSTEPGPRRTGRCRSAAATRLRRPPVLTPHPRVYPPKSRTVRDVGSHPTAETIFPKFPGRIPRAALDQRIESQRFSAPLTPMTGDQDMESFFTTTGSSPPQQRQGDTAGHDPCRQEQEGTGALPEELVDALAGLLAEALINDIRQYPDLHLSPALLPDSADVQVIAPAGLDARPQQSERHRHTSARSRVRRPAHAPSD